MRILRRITLTFDKLCLFVLIALSSYFAYVVSIKNGAHFCAESACGRFYWGSHSVDGLWHVALIDQSFKSIPFTIPIFSGESLGGYNYLLDLIASLLQILPLHAHTIYFVVLPIVWIVGFHVLVMALGVVRKKSLTNVVWQLFFMLFGTGLYFVFALWHHNDIMQTDGSGGVHILTNLQFAFSLSGILATLYILLSRMRIVWKIISVAVLVWIVTGLKFYAGAILCVVLIGYVFSELKQRRLGIRHMFMWITTVGLSFGLSILALYDPFHASGIQESVFSFAPFALANRLIEEPDRLYIPYLALARYTLLEDGWGPRLIALETFAVIVFITVEFGGRCIGLLYALFKFVRRTLDSFDVGIMAGVVAGLVLSLSLVQRGQWWNVIQFTYVSMFLVSFLCADALEALTRSYRKIGIGMGIFLVIIALPFNVVASISFNDVMQGVYVDDTELRLLAKVHDLKGETIQTLPLQVPRPRKPIRPLPIQYQNDSPYVAAYSGKAEYVGPVEILKVLNVNYQDRIDMVRAGDIKELQRDIDYLYIYGDAQPYCNYVERLRGHGEEILTEGSIHVYAF